MKAGRTMEAIRTRNEADLEVGGAGGSGRLRKVARRHTVILMGVVVCLLAYVSPDLSAETPGRRRAVKRPAPAPVVQSWYVVERAETDFGELLAGEARTIEGAIVIRVFSNSDWILSVSPRQMQLLSGGVSREVSADRLAVRSRETDWTPLGSALPVIVAQGVPTASSGDIVTIDVKIELHDRDGTGRFGGELEVLLEPM